MAHRSKKTVAGLIAGTLLLAVPVMAGSLEFEVRHERMLRDRHGLLAFDPAGVSFRQTVKKGEPPRQERWDYPDIQELRVAPRRIVIVTYVDRPWLFGMDREFEFHAESKQNFDAVYAMLKGKLDRRLVVELADSPSELRWAVPVKRTGFIRGSEGILEIGRERVVYRSGKAGESRTWRYSDLDSVSSSGPFELTLTTYERSKKDYGSLRSFSFQLKEPLDQSKYDALWKSVAGLHR